MEFRKPILGDKQGDVRLRILHMYGIFLRRLFFVAAVVYSGSWPVGFFYMADVNNFLSVN